MPKRLECKVSFHQVDKSESVESVITEKMSAVFEKYDKLVTKVAWTCSKEHESFVSKVTVSTITKPIHFEAEGETVYSTVSDCVKKIDHELSKQKGKQSHIHAQKSIKEVV